MSPHPFYVNKWASLAASLASLLVAGLAYVFALYADDLKRRLGLDQRGIDTVATAANLGSYISLPAGATYDALATRYPRAGPKVCMVVGATVMHFGYLALALAARNGGGGGGVPGAAASAPALALAAAAAFAASNGATWLDAAALATAVRNHARQRGPAAGVLKGAVGLSGSIFTVVYAAAFAGDTPAFLAFLAAAPPAVALLAAPFVNVVPFDQADEWGRDGAGAAVGPGARFSAAGAVLVALAVYASTATIILRGPSAAALSSGARGAVVGGMVVVAAGLALLPAGAGGLAARPAPGQGGDEVSSGEGDEDGVTEALLASEGDAAAAGDDDDDDDDDAATPLLPCLRPADAIRSAKFGLLFFTSFVVGGTGLT
jgi:MFS family permease